MYLVRAPRKGVGDADLPRNCGPVTWRPPGPMRLAISAKRGPLGGATGTPKHGMALSDAAMHHMGSQTPPAEIAERTHSMQSASGRACIPVLQHTLLANGHSSVCHWSLTQSRAHDPAKIDLNTILKQPYLRTGIPVLGQC